MVDQHRSNLLDKGVSFSIDVADGIDVSGEEFLLETALNNLVQNAIDFSRERGTVWISLTLEKHTALIIIKDEGCGIPAFAINRIFDRFYSLPRPGSEQKSSGLGLCFAKEATELHNGSLSIANNLQHSGVIAELRLDSV